MDQLPYWNHYPWLKNKLEGRRAILDVGCGDGTLCRYLQISGRTVTGIDASPECISHAEAECLDKTVRFSACTFADFEAEGNRLDGILFSASLHHMDMQAALEKTVRLLCIGVLYWRYLLSWQK